VSPLDGRERSSQYVHSLLRHHARNFVDTGKLSGNLIYPSVLTQPVDKTYVYLPRHYMALALAYAAFGFGAIQSLLPNMVAYVVASLALFAATLKLYGKYVATAARYCSSSFRRTSPTR
jgi:hypothetical protein